MAQYLLLIYGDETVWTEQDSAETERIHSGHAAFMNGESDAIRGGQQLAPASTATSVRLGTNGNATDITDGPFLETKEVLGGYYVIEASDLDEAIHLASQLPETKVAHSGVEIRPVVVQAG